MPKHKDPSMRHPLAAEIGLGGKSQKRSQRSRTADSPKMTPGGSPNGYSFSGMWKDEMKLWAPEIHRTSQSPSVQTSNDLLQRYLTFESDYKLPKSFTALTDPCHDRGSNTVTVTRWTSVDLTSLSSEMQQPFNGALNIPACCMTRTLPTNDPGSLLATRFGLRLTRILGDSLPKMLQALWLPNGPQRTNMWSTRKTSGLAGSEGRWALLSKKQSTDWLTQPQNPPTKVSDLDLRDLIRKYDRTNLGAKALYGAPSYGKTVSATAWCMWSIHTMGWMGYVPKLATYDEDEYL